MSEQSQLNSILRLIENPVRRKILKRLSQEPSYPLELAKEIGEAQQLVTSHLALLEKAGIVSSSLTASPLGPNRKSYFLKQSAYLSISFGPHLFNEQFLNFKALPEELSKPANDFMKRISEIKENNNESKIEPFSCLFKDIDDKLEKLEGEKTVLLFIRDLAMKHASENLEEQHKTHDERRILHYILDERSSNIENISKALNLKESLVRSMLEKLKEENPYYAKHRI
jgi:ArsR family transcriptional regulator